MANRTARALGLSDAAGEDEIVAAIEALQAAKFADAVAHNNVRMDAGKYVPRARYEEACASAAKAERQIQLDAEAALKSEIETAINGFISAGKIIPAQKPLYVALCSTREGFETVKRQMTNVPQLSLFSDIQAFRSPPGEHAPLALNTMQDDVARALGLNSQALADYRNRKNS